MELGIRRTSLLVLVVALELEACSTRERSQPAAPPAPAVTAAQSVPSVATPAPGAAPEAAALARAADAARELGRTLKARVVEAMAASGPVGALGVCATEAQSLTGQVGNSTSARVGRASSRLRNPANAGPEWVRAELERLGERSAAGVAPVRTLTEVDGRQVARFAGPIAIEGPCLTCHGPREALAEDLRAALAERYPEDRAVGYALGDLRGLIWAEVDVH